MSKKINITLRVWRQKNKDDRGAFEEYNANNIDIRAGNPNIYEKMLKKLSNY